MEVLYINVLFGTLSEFQFSFHYKNYYQHLGTNDSYINILGVTPYLNTLFVTHTNSDIGTNFDPHNGSDVYQFGVDIFFWRLHKYLSLVESLLGLGDGSIVFSNISTIFYVQF